ncbi:MAG: hypothetical protein OZ921_21530, partial [Sorangiineae bacterium]|nr:hypothetical protein [Sorangiineae bacterium]
AEPAPASPRFPPAAVTPPNERTAAPGDGAWSELAPGLAKTLVHPHAFKKHVVVTVVAMELARLEVHLAAGTLEPEAKGVPAERRTGLVPADQRARLVAVFNGGFKERHGGFGMRLGDDDFTPPKPAACTVVLTKDSRVAIGTWERVAERARESAGWRQTPPCLIEDGAPHPDLKSEYKSRKWGMSAEGKTDIRRSALAVDESGGVLYFALGEWLTAPELARGLLALGVRDAAELDVNYSYTRFLTYPADGGAPVGLVKDVKHARGEYTDRPSARDFFYVLTAERSPRGR